jgi:hypothetical protein
LQINKEKKSSVYFLVCEETSSAVSRMKHCAAASTPGRIYEFRAIKNRRIEETDEGYGNIGIKE